MAAGRGDHDHDYDYEHEEEHDGLVVIYCMTRGRRGVRVGGMQADVPRSLTLSLDLSYALMEAAMKTAKAGKGAQRPARPKRGLALKPGVETPLWNELSAAVKAQLNRRGEKAKLARILGVPRQRVHDFFNKRSALPDAERTLLLLAWLHARNHGQDLG